MLSVADIKRRLQDDIRALVGELLPEARKAGSIYQGRNPRIEGSKPTHFTIWCNGSGAGAWKDYAGVERGDVIDLIAYLALGASHPFSNEDRGAAIQWAKKWLKLDDASPEDVRKWKQERRAAHAKKLAEDEERKRERRARAFELWLRGKLTSGTPVETYLATRGLDYAALQDAHPDDFVRYIPDFEHFEARRRFPAMIAAFRNADSVITGLHVTWLAPDGSAKADVDKPKMMFGTVAGSAIHLTRGESDKPPAMAASEGISGPLAIGEGIETMLSVAQACPEIRTWAAGSLDNIGNAPEHSCVASYIVCRDNDLKPAAIAAFERGVEKLRARGKPVSVARAHGGVNDFNDLMRRRKSA
jgi:hypothetical protein